MGILLMLVTLMPGMIVTAKEPGPSERLLERAEVSFDTISTHDGLSNNTVMALAQDAVGFIWIGTLGGLNRFDGFRIRTFDHDPADPHSLPNGLVRTMLPLPDGGLWLGTHNAGIALYDPRTDQFTSLGAGPEGLGHVQVYALASDGADGAWVATLAGLDHVGRDLKVRERYRAGDGSSFPAGYVFAAFRDSKGTLWVGTESGVARRRPGETGWQTIASTGPAAAALATGTWSFYEDGMGRVWIGTNGGGVVMVPAGGEEATSVSGLTGPHTMLGRATVRGIVETVPGTLWMVLFGGGIAEYETGSGELRLLQADSSLPRALKGNFNRAILKDRGGIIWVATNMGVARHDSVPTGVAGIAAGTGRGFSGRDVWSLWADAGQALWVGLDDGGLDRIDLATGAVAALGRQRFKTELDSTPIYSVLGDDKGSLWVGTAGLRRLPLADASSGLSGPVLAANRDITTLYADNRHLWVGTYYGLTRHGLADGTQRHFTAGPGAQGGLTSNEVRTLLGGDDGLLWIGTANGLNVLRPDGSVIQMKREPSQPGTLPHDYVSSLARDQQGRLWLGTVGGGVAMLEKGWEPGKPPDFRVFSRGQGMPSNTIASMALGTDGRMWIGTDDGLAAINTRDYTVTRIEKSDGGTINSYLPGSVATLADGGIVFGGTEGMTLVQPNLVRRPVYKGMLAVTSLQAGSHMLNAAALNLSDKAYSIAIPVENRRLALEFSLLDYAAPELLRFAYRLDGFDPDWINVGPDRRVAAYTNLPPGSYDLHLRTLTRDGTVVAERVLGVTVPYRWYEWPLVQGLGVLALILLAAGLVMLRVRARIAKLDRMRAELEAKVEERTASLMEANARLAELATRDPLTGLFNRRAFMEKLEAEWRRHGRYQDGLSLLLLDLDDFKQVNDRHGHLVGDGVIREAARRVREALRDNDVLARFGGEELIILLPHADLAVAEQIAERVRQAVGGQPMQVDGCRITITASLGAAAADSSLYGPEGLIDRADGALYVAKAAGRNRVAMADPRVLAENRTG